MALFKIQTQQVQRPTELSVTAALPAADMVAGRKADLMDAVADMKQGTCLMFQTDGKWSTHELLNRLLALTGPASVRISTYSMTEDPVRMLVNQLTTGQITDIEVICDTRFTAQQANAHQLAAANFPLRLTQVHAKCMTVCNDQWNLSVIGSANFTRNKRMECGVIIDDAAICAFNTQWIENAGR